MKTVLAVFGGLAAFIAIIVLGYALTTGDMIFERHAAPYREETRRETFQNSVSMAQGTAIDLDNLCQQWKSEKDPAAKTGLADTIRLRSSLYEIDNLPSQVAACVREATN